jgi:hypothetical protein
LIWAIGFWTIGGASAAAGTPAVAINNPAANHSAKANFFLPSNCFLPDHQRLFDTRDRQPVGSEMSNLR